MRRLAIAAAIASAGALALLGPAALVPSAWAQSDNHPATETESGYMKPGWSFTGPFGHYDRASAQRGYEIYKNVCSNCHSMSLLSYRDLESLGLSDEQVKAVAAEVQVPALSDTGEAVERPALPSDRFKAPFANEAAARAANGGALPPDQSLIVKAREDGPDYIYSLLQGYTDPPAGTKVPDGQYYNKYFPGHFLAMPQPLRDDQVTYSDGTKATLPQEARDIVEFLTWASEPTMEARKRLGVKMVLFLALLTGLTYSVKKRVWRDVH